MDLPIQRSYKSLCYSTSLIIVEEEAERSWGKWQKHFCNKKDHDGGEFIVQIIKECDKNHWEDDTNESNQARIYAIPD